MAHKTYEKITLTYLPGFFALLLFLQVPAFSQKVVGCGCYCGKEISPPCSESACKSACSGTYLEGLQKQQQPAIVGPDEQSADTAAPAKAASSCATLKHCVAELQEDPYNQELRGKIIKLALRIKPKPILSEDVGRYMARGTTAMKEAKTAEDFGDAVNEFEKATLAAPWFANAYYNLGVAQSKTGNYAGAKQNLKLYLLAAPEAGDAKEAKNLIYQMEYKQEKETKDKAGMEARYGGRHHTFSFDKKDLYQYGSVFADMPAGTGGESRTISVKMKTSKQYGSLNNEMLVCDFTSANGSCRGIPVNWRGSQIVRFTGTSLSVKMTDSGSDDAEIEVSPTGNAGTDIKTTLNRLHQERARQAVYAGYQKNINGKDFFIIGQGGGNGSLAFFPTDIAEHLADGSARTLSPIMVVLVNKRENNKDQILESQDLGLINGKHYYYDTAAGEVQEKQ